jgi:hypothetical protein
MIISGAGGQFFVSIGNFCDLRVHDWCLFQSPQSSRHFPASAWSVPAATPDHPATLPNIHFSIILLTTNSVNGAMSSLKLAFSSAAM